jgi:hypothetical protein
VLLLDHNEPDPISPGDEYEAQARGAFVKSS